MNFAPLSQITILPNRQRREHDEAAHQELVTSIQGPQGLMHPPVMRQENGSLILVAGERRMKAMIEIWEFGGIFKCNGEFVKHGQVPYLALGELSLLEAEEAEYEENVRRSDLSWQERAEAEAKLFELRTRRAKEEGKPPPSVVDVAIEARGNIPSAFDGLSKSIVLARNMHREEVRTAASPQEAFKALMRGEEAERNRLVGERLGPTLGSKHTAILGDCLEWMKNQPPAQFDIICSDPPYAMGADEFGDSGGAAAGAHFYKDDESVWLQVVGASMPDLYRLAKPDAHAYLFCDFARFPELSRWMDLEGWKVFRTPLIWFKPSAFRAPWPDQGPQRKYECILYAVKGSLKTTTLRGDVIQCPTDVNLGHQAQKPVPLYLDLLARSVRPGMKVLDPFMGTGPIFPAAHALGAIATGVEQDPSAYGIAVGRVAKLKEK